MTKPETNKPDAAERAAEELREWDRTSGGVWSDEQMEACAAIIRQVCKPDLPKLPEGWEGPFKAEYMWPDTKDGRSVWSIISADNQLLLDLDYETAPGFDTETAKRLRDLLNAVDAQQKGGE